MKDETKRPPLGLVPKWVRDKERFAEVCEAISRYYNEEYVIPISWVEEYNELVIKIKNHDKKKLSTNQ